MKNSRKSKSDTKSKVDVKKRTEDTVEDTKECKKKLKYDRKLCEKRLYESIFDLEHSGLKLPLYSKRPPQEGDDIYGFFRYRMCNAGVAKILRRVCNALFFLNKCDIEVLKNCRLPIRSYILEINDWMSVMEDWTEDSKKFGVQVYYDNNMKYIAKWKKLYPVWVMLWKENVSSDSSSNTSDDE